MAQGLTLEQLQKMGAKPTPTTGGGLSLTQLQNKQPSTPQQAPPTSSPGPGWAQSVTDLVGGTALASNVGSFLAKHNIGTGMNLTPQEQSKNISYDYSGKQALGSAASVGLNIAALAGVGTGGGLLAQSAKTAALTGGMNVAGKLAEGKNLNAPDLLTSLAIGAAIPSIAKGFGAVLDKINMPGRLVQSIGGVTKDSATQALESGKWGTTSHILNQSKVAQKALEGQLQSELASKSLAPVRIETSNVLDALAQKMNAGGAKETANTVYKTLNTALRNSRGLLEQPQLSLVETNQLRRNIDAVLNDRSFAKKLNDLPVTKQVLRQASTLFGNTVKEVSRSTLEAVGHPNSTIVEDIFNEYSKEINFSKALQKSIKPGTVLSTKDILRAALGPVGGALAGGVEGYRQSGVGGAIKGAVIGGAAGELLKPAGRVNAAQVLKTVGKITGAGTRLGAVKYAGSQ